MAKIFLTANPGISDDPALTPAKTYRQSREEKPDFDADLVVDAVADSVGGGGVAASGEQSRGEEEQGN